MLRRIYRQMAALNRAARDVMVDFSVHGCTDVTGFALLGHGYEMAQGSGCSLHILKDAVPVHGEARELAAMGFLPAGAYRNRAFAEAGVSAPHVDRATLDLFFDPQTSGGLLFSLKEEEAEACLSRLRDVCPGAAIIGYVTERGESAVYVE